MNVAIYARVSTVRQAEADLSIPDQLNRMRAWCRSNGYTIVAEYVEPGATATDDRRPVFQKMVDAATTKPYPFQAIIVHSRSRFFRDVYGALHYERQLEKAGARVMSITQPTTDDATGEMMRQMISMMDAYSSKENAKHTSRAMQENARRGFFNGSRAPFGYMAIETDVTGHKGKMRKRLVIHEEEAQVVRYIYDLYLHGSSGQTMGMKAIVEHLNAKGTWMRGHRWRVQKLAAVLSDLTYRGEYCFNMRDAKTKQVRPESEWVRTPIDPIVDEATFDAVRRLREQRDPKTPGGSTTYRQMMGPTLLGGKIRCTCCDCTMKLATGKGGRYRYYTCAKKVRVSFRACTTPNLPMEATDQLVLKRLAARLLVPERVTKILQDWLKYRAQEYDKSDAEAKRLSRALQAAEDGLNNLYAAVEQGKIALDSTLQTRINSLRDKREKVLIELALVQRERPSPQKLSPKQVEFACERMRTMLLDRDSGWGKKLLGLLVTDIRVESGSAKVTGSSAALEQLVSEMKAGTSPEVPISVPDWRGWRGSNPRPLASEANTLSTELQPRCAAAPDCRRFAGGFV